MSLDTAVSWVDDGADPQQPSPPPSPRYRSSSLNLNSLSPGLSGCASATDDVNQLNPGIEAAGAVGDRAASLLCPDH